MLHIPSVCYTLIRPMLFFLLCIYDMDISSPSNQTHEQIAKPSARKEETSLRAYHFHFKPAQMQTWNN